MNDQLIASLKELIESVDCLRGSVEELNKHLIELEVSRINLHWASRDYQDALSEALSNCK